MAQINAFYPPSGGGSSSNASVGSNGVTAPTSSTEVAGINPSGNLQPLQTSADGALIVVNDPTAEQHVIVDSSALPTGASTSALQTSGNASLTTIATNSGTQATAANQTTGNGSLATIATNTTGASTAALQTSGNASLTTIATNTPTVGQKAMAGSSPVVIASDQSSIPVTIAAGAATIGTVNQGTANTAANGWPVKVTDGTNTGAVKAASTAAAATDPAIVVALSPNNNTLANALFVKNSDGTNTAAVKAASTTPIATDPALVVSISPNSASLAVTQGASAGVSNAPTYLSYGSTTVTTAAYTQLVAATSSATTYVDIFDSSGQGMILATGAAGSEVILYYVPPGGDQIHVAIPASTRIAIKALTANATSGYILLNLLK